jgi:sterol desaturase/sphingolipid hydroxylase (fatty acid hydroxylase superfamily)
MALKTYLSFSALLVIFLLETMFPYFKGRKHRVLHGAYNICLSLINSLLYAAFFSVLALNVMQWSQVRHIGLIYHISLPEPLKLIIVFILFDIWMYFWHRINHRVSLFWLFHRVHHTDREMDVTTANRFHPIEIMLSSLIRLPVFVLIGTSAAQFVMYEIVLILVIQIHHSNIALPEKIDRFFRLLLVTPNMHRVHHSVEWSETNSNFASIFSFWDRMWQTFRYRKNTLTLQYGLHILKEKKWQNFSGMLLTPFKNFSFKLYILK